MDKSLRKPTIRQVAAIANVSPTTVSIVLNGDSAGGKRIPAVTQSRVMEAVAELGYVPNQSARSLRRRRTDRVCLFINAVGIPYNDILTNVTDQIADQNGYSLILAVGGSPEREHRVMNQLMRGLADGVIIVGSNTLTNDEISSLASSGCAVVVSDNFLTPQGVDCIRTTEAQTSYQAMQYLFDQGHRRIGFIGNLSGLRYKSYEQFCAAHQLFFSEEYLQQDSGVSRENAFQSTLMIIQNPQLPTAIFCASDLAAISAISAIRSIGKRIPEDIAVIGSGNIPEGLITTPRLSTIGPNQLDFSVMIEMLFSRLRGEAPQAGRFHTIQWNLILRASA